METAAQSLPPDGFSQAAGRKQYSAAGLALKSITAAPAPLSLCTLSGKHNVVQAQIHL